MYCILYVEINKMKWRYLPNKFVLTQTDTSEEKKQPKSVGALSSVIMSFLYFAIKCNCHLETSITITIYHIQEALAVGIIITSSIYTMTFSNFDCTISIRKTFRSEAMNWEWKQVFTAGKYVIKITERCFVNIVKMKSLQWSKKFSIQISNETRNKRLIISLLQKRSEYKLSLKEALPTQQKLWC